MSARAQALAAAAAPPDAEDLASWFWSLIDAGFLAEAGFDAQRKVLFPRQATRCWAGPSARSPAARS